MSRTFFSSDWHIGHASILNPEYTPRGIHLSAAMVKHGPDPAITIDDHDQWLVNLINDQVGERDYLYFLGDLGLGNHWRVAYYVSQIKCVHKVLIPGNHDFDKMDFYRSSGLFETIVEARMEIKLNGKRIVMDHHPIAEWNNGHYQAWHLHGHCHGDFNYERAGLADKRILDVGLDNSIKVLGHYGAFEFEDVAKYMEGRVSIEHHGKAD
jgi:calcineurin-like phosphoesterase family protein